MAENKSPVVAFLGPEASYTHQATLDSFPPPPNSPTPAYTFSPQTTIEDVFSAVQSGTAHRGVVPFENSSNGSVVFTLDLFADKGCKFPDIAVCGEAYVGVRHCLLVNPSLSNENEETTASTKPHDTVDREALRKIKKIYSHPQAWGQCTTYLTTHFKGTERQDVSSTSRAAELVSQDESGTSAAISSPTTAEVFNLRILSQGIEDREGNCTRFLVLRKRESGREEGERGGGYRDVHALCHAQISSRSDRSNWNHGSKQDGQDADGDETYKTLISFTIDHQNPGALAASLSCFSRYNLNLTSINSRPSGVENWNYIFFVEIKGRWVEATTTYNDREGVEGRKVGKGQREREESAVNKALRDLGDVCRGWRWLGSWRNGLEEGGR